MSIYRHLCLAVLIAALALCGYAAHTQTAIGDYKHLGVASCASSVCHGKSKAQANQNVGLNEYRIWMDQDLHAQAYRALESPKSKQIALKLGLPNASSAKSLGSKPCSTETTRMARVVMAYTFSDVDSGEELVAKVAGQGLDTGDKAPYKAMTGALKYALRSPAMDATLGKVPSVAPKLAVQ